MLQGSGGHYLRSPNIRVTQVTRKADAAGVTEGYISVRNPQTGAWVPKPGLTTFYPANWSKRQTMQEIEGAFLNSKPLPKLHPKDSQKWEGVSPSGIRIQGYYKVPEGGGSTAWLVYSGKDK